MTTTNLFCWTTKHGIVVKSEGGFECLYDINGKPAMGIGYCEFNSSPDSITALREMAFSAGAVEGKISRPVHDIVERAPECDFDVLVQKSEEDTMAIPNGAMLIPESFLRKQPPRQGATKKPASATVTEGDEGYW